jgi:hypothetical protein
VRVVRKISLKFAPCLAFVWIATLAGGQDPLPKASFPPDSAAGFEAAGTKPEAVAYRGRRAIKLLDSSEQSKSGGGMAILKGSDFKDGVIEGEIAGMPRAGAPTDIRGFLGIAFRVQSPEKYECFYIRATNGRADDQVRRNHSTQYISAPDYPWERLRKENPGMYESYVDLEPGAWTKIKIVVSSAKAKLYVNGADQPTLIVNDLKLGESRGQIALWIGVDTEAYFSRITVK